MNFWTGLIIGMILCANIGLLASGLLSAAKRGDAVIENDLGSGEFLRWVFEERRSPDGAR